MLMSRSFQMDADWLPFCPDPSKPSAPLPAGAVDAHCHIFGPGDRFPYAAERKYTPCDAGRDELFRLRDFLGFDKNVIVQASCHGTDNSAMVDALRAANGRARGVAVVRGDVSDEELRGLHDAGVRGVRFNFVSRLVDPKPDEYYRAIAERIAPLGWHVVVYLEASDLAERRDLFTSLPAPIVVDHMGRPDVTQAVTGPEFERFMTLMRDHPQFWVKVTCPERLTVSGSAAYDDVVPFAKALVDEFPERVLWGTDWPHPNLRGHMPDDGKLVDYVHRIATTEEARHRLLVANPHRLYWGSSGMADDAELDDIPGTVVFTGKQSRKGFHLNQFCMSLTRAENRARFKADERSYIDEWPMTEEQKKAVLDRDWNAAIAHGGNIYFLAKILATDGTSFPEAASVMTGVSVEEYAALMLAGGRSPEGQRSIKEGR
jgi:2-pyrone-4,6-dicarboxylate lactonase